MSNHNKRLYLVHVKTINDQKLYLGNYNASLAAVPLGLYIKREYPLDSDQAYTYVSFTDAQTAEKIIRKALSNKKPDVFMQYAFADIKIINATGEFESDIILAREKYDNSVQLDFNVSLDDEELVAGFGFGDNLCI